MIFIKSENSKFQYNINNENVEITFHNNESDKNVDNENVEITFHNNESDENLKNKNVNNENVKINFHNRNVDDAQKDLFNTRDKNIDVISFNVNNVNVSKKNLMSTITIQSTNYTMKTTTIF